MLKQSTPNITFSSVVSVCLQRIKKSISIDQSRRALPCYLLVEPDQKTASKQAPIKQAAFKKIAGKKATWFTMVALTLSACQSLPKKPHTQDSLSVNALLEQRYAQPLALPSSTSTDSGLPSISETTQRGQDNSNLPSLNTAIQKQNQRHPGLSGYHPIVTGSNAFAARSLLTDMSTKSIDVQYYIWHNDQAGQLLLRDLWEAAERGVLIRFLLDDFNTDAKLDAHLLAFASHPNIAVRLINPLPNRKFQTLNYLTSMPRINYRMHNKSMTFDRQLSIIGGRNIGDEYMSNSEGSNFADLDVMLIGDVVKDIDKSFEQYWQSPLSYDVQTLVQPTLAMQQQGPPTGTRFVKSLDQIRPNADADLARSLKFYDETVKRSLIGTDLVNQQVPFRWANMIFLVDHVDKLTQTEVPSSKLVYQLRRLLGTPTENLSIVSSYFVPTEEGVATLIALAEQGVNIQLLTNSFRATDVTAVHSGYAKWRQPMLQAGIDIYELKPTASEESRENKLWRARSQSSTSLHAKTFAVDNQNIFIGSYNIDPRSANINTELGVVIEDADLALQLHNTLDDDLMTQAYKVVLTAEGDLQWQTIEGHQLIIYDDEPDVGITDKVWLKMMGWLPIDWML